MADSEVEKEWDKSKRIEAERMKAIRDLEERKPDSSGLALLDPKQTKVKGWSKDPDVVIADIERMGDRALIFVIGGVVLAIIGYVGGMATEGFHLGAGGVIISGLPNGIGLLSMGVGALMALATIGVDIYFRVRSRRKLGSSFWTAIVAIVVVVIYFVVRWVMSRMW